METVAPVFKVSVDDVYVMEVLQPVVTCNNCEAMITIRRLIAKTEYDPYQVWTRCSRVRFEIPSNI